jgi:hypothetical protein
LALDHREYARARHRRCDSILNVYSSRADAEVRKQYHVPVDSFERSAFHVASETSWFISYHPHFLGDSPHSHRDAAFVMQVDEKTRRAFRVYE